MTGAAENLGLNAGSSTRRSDVPLPGVNVLREAKDALSRSAEAQKVGLLTYWFSPQSISARSRKFSPSIPYLSPYSSTFASTQFLTPSDLSAS